MSADIEAIVAELADRAVDGELSWSEIETVVESAELTPLLVERVTKALAERDIVVEQPRLDQPVARETRVAGPGDPVRAYLDSISRVALLSAEEERELTTLVQAGRAARRALTAKEPSLARERELKARVAAADAARDRIVNSHLRLVVSIAKRYRHRGIGFLDLIQEGNTGLLRAVERFEPERELRVSTYATWWIHQALGRAVANHARTIRLPVHVYETLNRVMRMQRTLLQELGSEPTVEQLATRLALSPDQVNNVLTVDRSMVSFDASSSEDGADMHERLADSEAEAPGSELDRREVAAMVRAAIETLGAREREVMRMRFGLSDGRVHSLNEVGEVFGVTKERIRQIESKTLAKLRVPLAEGQVEEYLAD